MPHHKDSHLQSDGAFFTKYSPQAQHENHKKCKGYTVVLYKAEMWQ